MVLRWVSTSIPSPRQQDAAPAAGGGGAGSDRLPPGSGRVPVCGRSGDEAGGRERGGG